MSFPKPQTKTQKQRRAKREREYAKARDEYLHEHLFCEICRDIATEIHHVKGRLGKLLTDKENFLAVCPPCHQTIEANPAWAREHGYKESRLC